MTINLEDRIITFNTVLEGNPSTFIHFKNKKYQIICIALDSSDLRKMVIYKSLYDDKIYSRELEEFFSLVDRKKYPDIKQKYRFELEE